MNRQPAEVFPVGEYIQEELDERGWSVAELADRAVLKESDVAGLIDGSVRMRNRHAERLGIAFGTSGALWANLNLSYRKWMERRARREAIE